MKKAKKSIKNRGGISLIVLIITIIVVIVLAAAVIISLQNNNPMVEANRAKITSDVANMQAIFTNTVGKIMAEKQEVIEIVANKLNEPITTGKSVVGEAVYKIGGEVAGKIIFDNKKNDGENYYTGKKLPVYNKDTTWYVDEDGILRLQVGEETYGEGTGEEEKLNENIKISTNIEVSDDFTKATLGVVIEYEGDIESVTINGEIVEVVKNDEGKYVGNKEVRENGNYNIVAIAKDGSKNKEVIKVDEITEDMEIWNKADMELFRDKVNSGRTFEGRKVTVMDDIDLQGNSNNRWTAINKFLGFFEGNNHIIDGLYIDNNLEHQGLFSINQGTIQNVNIRNGYVKSTNIRVGMLVGGNAGNVKNIKVSGSVEGGESTGGIIGWFNASNKEIELCENNATVISNDGQYTGGIVGGCWIGNIKKCINNGEVRGVRHGGGIVGGQFTGEISLCINNGNISARGYNNEAFVGGISGYSCWNSRGTVSNCYNTGEIKTEISNGVCGGICGAIIGENGYILVKNCYNIGKIINGVNKGGIIAWINQTNGGTYDANSNYFLNTCGATNGIASIYSNSNCESVSEAYLKSNYNILGLEYISDTTNINEGFPILSWQVNK